MKLAECMRENGDREFPDPDASGRFASGIRSGSSLDPSRARWVAGPPNMGHTPHAAPVRRA